MMLTSASCLLMMPHSLSETRTCYLKKDYQLLLTSAMSHPSVNTVAAIAPLVSWRRLWIQALDHSMKGTRYVRSIFKSLCQPIFGNKICPLRNCQIGESCLVKHLFKCHPSLMDSKSLTEAMELISSLDKKFFISLGSRSCCLTLL